MPAEEDIQRLSVAINVSKPLAIMLLQRGIGTYEEAKVFFNPSLDLLHDPMLMKDMDKAVARLQEALQKKERILLYGDYDVDGTTAVSMMHTFLKPLSESIDFYVPDRYTEGYGVSEKGILYAKEQGYSLIISLDCGIKSHARVAQAASLGIDFIVCDHHQPDPILPEAVAVLDPKRTDCPYPYKELTGCGVGFKLLQGLSQGLGLPPEPLWQLLDFVAISIACDIVPITGENRILAKFGLAVVNQGERIGVKALKKASGFTSALDISNLVFGLGPRINAAGRIAHAKQAVELLLATDEEMAAVLAQGIDDRNETRKEYDASITEEALAMIADKGLEEAKTTVLFSPNWHKGVIGIVASRCIEYYHRPTIILTESNGKATGSARSVRGFSIYDALCECDDLLEQWGGHDFAAGMTLAIEQVPAFQARFEEVVSRRIKPEQLVPTVEIDALLNLEQLTPNFYKVLARMEPFGPENMTPVFAAKDLAMLDAPRLLKEKHLKLMVGQKGGHKGFPAMAFGMPDLYEKLDPSKTFDLAFSLAENTYNGNTGLQLYVRDAKW